MKYATQIGPGAVIYMPSFINIDSGIKKLMGRGRITDTIWKSHKPAFIFFKIWKVDTKYGESYTY
jgi:hypothetical protein